MLGRPGRWAAEPSVRPPAGPARPAAEVGTMRPRSSLPAWGRHYAPEVGTSPHSIWPEVPTSARGEYREPRRDARVGAAGGV